jgi:hypothetical protein
MSAHELLQTARQIIKNLFNRSYFRSKGDKGEMNGIIIGDEPRFPPKYDSNSSKDKLSELEPGVYTKIGQLTIREGRIQILQTIIHAEVHHWIYEQGFAHYNEELAELLAGHYAGAILDGWDGYQR